MYIIIHSSLFIISPNWKQLKSPSIGEGNTWINSGTFREYNIEKWLKKWVIKPQKCMDESKVHISK